MANYKTLRDLAIRHAQAAIEGAIRLLDQPVPAWGRGEVVETEGGSGAKMNG